MYVCLCVCLLVSQFFDLFFESCNSLFESCFLLLCLLEQLLGGIQFSLIHRLDVCRLFAPFRLQFLQLIGQTTVLSLQETNFFYVARKPLVQVLKQHTTTINSQNYYVISFHAVRYETTKPMNDTETANT